MLRPFTSTSMSLFSWSFGKSRGCGTGEAASTSPTVVPVTSCSRLPKRRSPPSNLSIGITSRQTEFAPLLGRDLAVRSPAAQLVVLRQHLRQLAYQTLRWTRWNRVFQQSFREHVAPLAEPSAFVPQPLQVPDALADLRQGFYGVRNAGCRDQ